jgi:hypothetical protein
MSERMSEMESVSWDQSLERIVSRFSFLPLDVKDWANLVDYSCRRAHPDWLKLITSGVGE